MSRKHRNRTPTPPILLKHIPKDEMTVELCVKAVKNDARNFRYMPDEFKTPELAGLAMQQNAANIAYVPEHLKTPEFCALAVRENIDNFKYVTGTFKTPELCAQAVQHDGNNLQYVPDVLKTPELCLSAIMAAPSGVKYVPETMTFPVQAAPQEDGAVLLTNAKGVEKRVWASRLAARGFPVTEGNVQLNPDLCKRWFNPDWMEEKEEELQAVLENPGKIRVKNVYKMAHACPMGSSVGAAHCQLMRKYFELFVEKGIMTEKGEWI